MLSITFPPEAATHRNRCIVAHSVGCWSAFIGVAIHLIVGRICPAEVQRVGQTLLDTRVCKDAAENAVSVIGSQQVGFPKVLFQQCAQNAQTVGAHVALSGLHLPAQNPCVVRSFLLPGLVLGKLLVQLVDFFLIAQGLFIVTAVTI